MLGAYRELGDPKFINTVQNTTEPSYAYNLSNMQERKQLERVVRPVVQGPEDVFWVF